MKIQSARQMHHASPFTKLSLYGPSGSGKTSWAARSPRPLILLTEAHSVPSIHAANPDAHVLVVTSYAEFRAAWDAIKSAPVGEVDGQPCIMIDDTPIQTVVLDSWTDLQRYMVEAMVGRKDGGDIGLDMTDGMSLPMWGKLLDVCTTIWRQQRGVPVNTVFVSLAAVEPDDLGRRMTVPMMSGKSAPHNMPSHFGAQGFAMVDADPAQGNSTYSIRFVLDTKRWTVKPAPGWPHAIIVTDTPGETTLGSLALYASGGDTRVPHMPHDSAEYVTLGAGKVAKPDVQPDPATTTTATTPSSNQTTSTTTRRRRRS